MKELTIQEKAKRYDKAIELVNSKWHYKNQSCFIDVSEIFPEIKETENESIREWLVGYFQEYKSTGIEGFANGLKIDTIIDWLEKQIDDRDIHLLKLKAKAYDDAKERISYAYNQNRVPIGFISEIFPNLNSYENQDNKLVSETNKIKPKFNINDWVVVNNNHQSIYQVEKIENEYYVLRHTHGGTFRVCVLHDKSLRLWTIKDARWGDVLASKDKRSILIFKHLDTDTSFSSYYNIALNINSGWSNECFIPATKEQCDLLFQNMKEKGYKWNDNTKEVIKL